MAERAFAQHHEPTQADSWFDLVERETRERFVDMWREAMVRKRDGSWVDSVDEALEAELAREQVTRQELEVRVAAHRARQLKSLELDERMVAALVASGYDDLASTSRSFIDHGESGIAERIMMTEAVTRRMTSLPIDLVRDLHERHRERMSRIPGRIDEDDVELDEVFLKYFALCSENSSESGPG